MLGKIKKLGGNISKLLRFSPDLIFGGMTVTLYSGKQAVVEGYKTILEYDDTMLSLTDGKRQVDIYGTDLILNEMSDEWIIVDGRIHSAEFSR